MSNSSPLAPWSVMMLTISSLASPSRSMTRLTWSRKAGKVLEFRERADQLPQVFEPAGGGGRAVLLPHLGVAGFVEHPADDLGMGRLRQARCASREAGRSSPARLDAGAGLELVGLDQSLRRATEGEAVRARELVDRAQRGLAEAALGQFTIRSKARSSSGRTTTRT